MLSAFEAAHKKYIEDIAPNGKHPQSSDVVQRAQLDYAVQYQELFQLGLLVLRNIDGVTSAHLLKLFPQLTAESLKQAGWSDTPSAMVEVTPTIYGASVKLPWKAKVSVLPMVYEVRNLQNEIVQSARETTNGTIDISGLLPETAYQLVVATSIGGASMIRSEQPFKTLTPPPPAPDPAPYTPPVVTPPSNITGLPASVPVGVDGTFASMTPTCTIDGVVTPVDTTPILNASWRMETSASVQCGSETKTVSLQYPPTPIDL